MNELLKAMMLEGATPGAICGLTACHRYVGASRIPPAPRLRRISDLQHLVRETITNRGRRAPTLLSHCPRNVFSIDEAFPATAFRTCAHKDADLPAAAMVCEDHSS
jgi:hypothetical protein